MIDSIAYITSTDTHTRIHLYTYMYTTHPPFDRLNDIIVHKIIYNNITAALQLYIGLHDDGSIPVKYIVNKIQLYYNRLL